MSKQVETAEAVAIVTVSRLPGFHAAMRVLESIAQQTKEAAFSNDDDSRAVRLIHEGRGAAKLLREFKATLATLAQTVDQLPQNPDSPDWR